ncbi:MAG: potassium transporter Kup [Roseivivax sp.]|nr:potassium transporter Kup [Roseivivax sp.]
MSPVIAAAVGVPTRSSDTSHRTSALTLGALGVVYGDIGTSPLYALREGIAASGGAATPDTVIGSVSLLLWLLIVIATLKYVVLMLRADNRGEGGTLSLLALCIRALGRRPGWLIGLGIAGTALFFGDAMITPAISVLSAVEGMALVAPGVAPLVVPVAVAILCALFLVQSRGTGPVARAFGPVMLVWFATMAGLGLTHIVDDMRILQAFNPLAGLGYLAQHGTGALPVLGAVFLAITGAEALYADMGHFGRRPIRLAWTWMVLPALAISYLGQGALILSDPSAARDPFFLQAPGWALPGLVALAMLATIIASQAVITGAFSFGYQAIQLGLMPRMSVTHTSAKQEGQIYLRRINIGLFVAVILLVVGFGSSAELATAYGIAVTGEMLITTALAAFVFARVWRWRPWVVAAIIVPLGTVELLLLSANLMKFSEGGWLPASIAALLALLMVVWVRGTDLVAAKMHERSVPVKTVLASVERSSRVCRCPGTAVFLTPDPEIAPLALLHNLKHNHVLHERNLIVSVRTANRPHIGPEERVVTEPLSSSSTAVRLTFGYMDVPNVPMALRQGVRFDIMTTSFFLDRRSYKITTTTGWQGYANRLFRILSHLAGDAHEHYRLPSDRVVEVGTQVTL